MSRYAVIDLEMCKVPKDSRRDEYPHGNEIIQIGAVLLDESLEICDSFMTYVHPEYGYVDSFIEELTGITKENTANAPGIAEAMRSFLEWIPVDAYIVSWSESDLCQICDELESKNIYYPELDMYLDDWIDCQRIFGDRLDTNRNYRLADALNMAAIYYDEGAHDGLVDAKNTALLFAKLEKELELKLSPYLSREEPERGTSNPFAELLNGLDFS